jgi:hypothetical protein
MVQADKRVYAPCVAQLEIEAITNVRQGSDNPCSRIVSLDSQMFEHGRPVLGRLIPN